MNSTLCRCGGRYDPAVRVVGLLTSVSVELQRHNGPLACRIVVQVEEAKTEAERLVGLWRPAEGPMEPEGGRP